MNDVTRTVVFWGLCVLLFLAPLPIGSVEEWAVFAFEAATIGLFLVFVVGELAARKSPKRDSPLSRPTGSRPFQEGGSPSPVRLPAAVKAFLGVFAAISVLQVLPLPPGLVKLLSPRAWEIYAGLVRDGLAAPASSLTLSLVPSASVSELVLALCYGLFGFLVLRTVRTRRQVEILVWVVLAAALFQAVYGMAETFSGHEMILGRPKRYGLGSVTGTFVNRNHLAGFLEMAFPLALGYLLAKARYFSMDKGLTWRQKVLWFGQERLQWTVLLGLVPVFIGLGLVFSKSRSGIMVFILTTLLAALAVSSWRELSAASPSTGEGEGIEGEASPRRHPRLGRVVRLTTAVVLAAAVWLGIGPVVARFAELDITKEARRVFYRTTFEMIGDFPLTGTGRGTYVDAYAMYEKVDDGLRLSFAHNDYLEFAAESGLVGGAALAAAGLVLFIWLVGRWRRLPGGFSKAVGLGAILAVAALLVHGLTDFNLQIPANAVHFTALAMLAAVVLAKEEDKERGENKGIKAVRSSSRGGLARLRHGPIGLAAAAVSVLVLLVLAWRDYAAFHHLGRYRRARSEARSVESAFPTLEARLERAVAVSPRAEPRLELARLLTEMARVANDAGREDEREVFCNRASSAYERAVAANPIHAFAHYEAGLVYLLSNYPLMTYADRAKVYFRKALELKPADDFLNLNVVFLYFTWWDALEEDERAYAGGLYWDAIRRDPAFGRKLEDRWKRSFPTLDGLKAVLATLDRPTSSPA